MSRSKSYLFPLQAKRGARENFQSCSQIEMLKLGFDFESVFTGRNPSFSALNAVAMIRKRDFIEGGEVRFKGDFGVKKKEKNKKKNFEVFGRGRLLEIGLMVKELSTIIFVVIFNSIQFLNNIFDSCPYKNEMSIFDNLCFGKGHRFDVLSKVIISNRTVKKKSDTL